MHPNLHWQTPLDLEFHLWLLTNWWILLLHSPTAVRGGNWWNNLFWKFFGFSLLTCLVLFVYLQLSFPIPLCLSVCLSSASSLGLWNDGAIATWNCFACLVQLTLDWFVPLWCSGRMTCVITPPLKDKLNVYALAIALHISDFKMDITHLRADLKVSQKKWAALPHSGCMTS